MKRKDLVRRLEKMGCNFIQHGGGHDWYQNPETKVSQPVPMHNEINENLAKHIIKMLKRWCLTIQILCARLGGRDFLNTEEFTVVEKRRR